MGVRITPWGCLDVGAERVATCGRWPCTTAVVFRRGVRIVLTGARVLPPRAAGCLSPWVAPRDVTAPRVWALWRNAGWRIELDRVPTELRLPVDRCTLERTPDDLGAVTRGAEARGAVARARLGCDRDAV